MEALHSFLKHSPMMAYLAMMAPRLVELHRVLKSTGSLYLHCDDVASHYLKLLLDRIFGPRLFKAEIVWKRTSSHGNVLRNYGEVTDKLLFYARSDDYTWNQVYVPYTDEHIARKFNIIDSDGRRFTTSDLRNPGYRPNLIYDYKGYKPHPNGWAISREKMEEYGRQGRLYFPPNKSGRIRLKRYLDETPGERVQNLWDDIPPINSQAQERLGYPTQKPQALLERIISASSNLGHVVLDPFCGCGTTIHAAQKLGRQWIGIDITYLAINLIKRRLKDAFGEEIAFEERGQPTDFASAKRLAELDKFQFQHWALSLIGARPLKEGEGKGADRGVDGLLYYYETERKDFPGRVREEPLPRSEPVHREKIIVQVKGGGVNRGDVATLLGDVENQKAAGGVLSTLEKPSKQMRTEAADAGRYTSKLWHDKDYPRIQILTVEGLLNGTERIDAPPQINPFAMAAREAKVEKQTEML